MLHTHIHTHTHARARARARARTHYVYTMICYIMCINLSVITFRK